MRTYDLVIVGAGPAGLIAGREAATRGLDALIIDKKSKIGEPLRCGEAFNEFVLKRFEIPYSKHYVKGHCKKLTVHSPKGSKILIRIPFDLYVLDRVELEKKMGRMAKKAGAEIRLNTICLGLKWKKDRYVLKTQNGEIGAKYVIGADGVEFRVGRWAGIKNGLPPKEMGKAALAIIGNIDIEASHIKAYMGGKYGSGGYAWVFPKGNHKANIGLGFVGTKKANPERTLKRFIKDKYPTAKVEYMNSGCLPMTMPLKKMHTKNLLVVGDAAHLVIPSTGGGIAYAMLSGKVAAEAVAKAIEYKAGDVELDGKLYGATSPQDVLKAYTKYMHDEADGKFKNAYWFKGQMIRDDKQINRDFMFYKLLFLLVKPFPFLMERMAKNHYF